MDLVSVVQGYSAFGIEQGAVLKNRPDLIYERLGIGNDEQISHYRWLYIKRLAKFGFIPPIINESLVQSAGSALADIYRVDGALAFIKGKPSYPQLLKAFRNTEFREFVEGSLTGDFEAPEALIVSADKDGRYVDLEFDIKDEKGRLIRYNVFVNGVPLHGAIGNEIDGRERRIHERIELLPGKNTIEVSCFNDRFIESYRDSVVVRSYDILPTDLYYVGFGVSKYADSQLDLAYAHKDALDLEKAFKAMDGGNYRRVYTQVFTDAGATRDSLDEARGFLAQARTGDTVILSISGHGLHDNDSMATYYYLTHEVDLDNLASTSVSFEEIEGLLQGIAPRRKLFLMDTCESGELDDMIEYDYLASAESRGIRARTIRSARTDENRAEGITSSRERKYLLENDRYIYNDLQRRTGAIVFSSCRGGELSYESDEAGNGFFTKSVLEAFTGQADFNGDGAVTSNELRAFVIDDVAQLSYGLQNPTIDRDNISASIVFPVVND